MKSNTTINREAIPVINENNSKLSQPCNTHTHTMANDQVFEMQLQAKVKEQQTLHGHMWVLELSTNVRTVSMLKASVFWYITLHHLGWQVLTYWRTTMPSLPRLVQIKNSFAVSGTAHPTMQNCITECCNDHLFRPFVSTEHQLHYTKC